ncbi:MAG: hypothetical protein IKX16_03595 [Clostridia bacterium]|nr:hypothetical protein [Clostridia bacterium]
MNDRNFETARIFAACPAIAGTVGLDGRPRVRRAEFLFEQNGAELTVSAKVVFTEDEAVLARGRRAKTEVFASAESEMFIAYFLTESRCEIASRGVTEEFALSEPEGVLIGISIKKKPELRDRICRVLGRRESEPEPMDGELRRLTDGALFVFAEAAKALWPRMDIRPIERAAVFETWDERERFTKLAARLIGNAQIDSPEDITYWLSPDTLKALSEKQARTS